MTIRHLALFLLIATLPAADYYVAPGGNDGNPGTSIASPLATVSAALAKTADGDRVLLARGGTYRGTFTVPDGRTLTAYGSGALPVVTASATVTLTGGGTIKTASVAASVDAVWIDGTFAPLARYPNTGWLTVDDGSTATSLVDAGLKSRAAGRFNGAQVRWRRWTWWWETRPITADNGASGLTIGGDPEVDANLVGLGSGYFIDNDLDELDADREWFWGGGTLSVRVPAGATTVEIATTTDGITASGGTIENIAFHRFAGAALTLVGRTTVRGCDFREIGTDAVFGSWNAYGSLVTGNTFRDVHNTAVTWNENPGQTGGTIIERNQIERIGMEYGYGGSGPWRASGIVITNGKPIVIRNNRIVDTGYAGVILGPDGMTVTRNVFVRCMGSLNDGAAIYTNCDNSIITENIILDTVGNLATSQDWTPLGHGIWIEFLDEFRDSEVRDNTIFGSNGHGIFLNNTYSNDVTGNTCIDNRLGGIHLSRGGDSRPANQEHTLSGNILAVVAPTRRQAWPENLADWANNTASGVEYEAGVDYGTMSSTTFVVPVGQRVARTDPGGVNQTLSQWQAANGSWAGSATHVAKHPIVLFNDTESADDIAVPAGSWATLAGASVSGTVNVAPFRSVVLVSDTAPAATPPYYAASGTDYRAPLTTPVLPVAPTIAVQPANRTVTAPAAAGLSVSANGTQPLVYVWERQAAGGGAWSTVAGANGPTLGVATSIADDGASYRCQVSNAAGSATSNVAVLTVLPAPAGGGGGGDGGGGGGGGCGLGSGLAALLTLLMMAFAAVRAGVRASDRHP